MASLPESTDARMSDRPAVQSLLADFSIEATPAQVAKTPDFSALVPAGSAVYVPFLPGAKFSAQIEACAKLARQGMRPVPHLPARAIVNHAQLADWLARFKAAGAQSCLLIAGDLSEPRGAFSNTLQILDSGLLEAYGFCRIAVAGHPEGHPLTGQAELDRALAHKAAYARALGAEMWVVTQFLFTGERLFEWLDRLARAEIDLPVRAGIPGPTKLSSLIGHAVQCGVLTSARMLGRQPGMAQALFGHWYPEEILGGLATYRAQRPSGRLSGIHIYPFGGVKRSAEWFGALRDGTTIVTGGGNVAHSRRRSSARLLTHRSTGPVEEMY